MDKHFIGIIVAQRELQTFASNQKLETVMAESGYDFISGPYESQLAAKKAMADFGDYAAFYGWRMN